MDAVTTTEVGPRLGIIQVPVRRLIQPGRPCRSALHRPGAWLPPAPIPKGLGERIVWAARCLLSDRVVGWLDPSERSRLKARLKELEAEDVHRLARNRAVVKRYRAFPSAIEQIRRELVPTGGRLCTTRRWRLASAWPPAACSPTATRPPGTRTGWPTHWA